MSLFVCKYCGSSTNNRNVHTSSCQKSPHQQHDWIDKQSKYTCRWCGYTSTISSAAAGSSCSKSPHKKSHEWLG